MKTSNHTAAEQQGTPKHALFDEITSLLVKHMIHFLHIQDSL